VQALLSLQFFGVCWQVPPLQESSVHPSPSLQSFGACWQAPPLQ